MSIAVVCRSWLRFRFWLLMLGVGCVQVTAGRAGDEPGSPAVTAPAPTYPTAIILDPPADRDALLSKLRRPDLILWDTTNFDHRGPSPGPSAASLPLGVVGSVAVVARLDRSRASLTVRLGINLAGDGSIVVPIAFDGLTLGRATEGGVDRPVRTLDKRRGWGVELSGQGEHVIEVETSVPLRSTGSVQSFELAIPPAAVTIVELIASRPFLMARAGLDEPLAIDPDRGRPHAGGHLSPRGRLELSWQGEEDPGALVPTVLAARGEVAITIGPAALESRETWSVAALRGEANRVVFRLQPDEELLALEVDQRSIPSDRRHREGTEFDELIVPLAEPINLGRTATLVLATRQQGRGTGPATEPVLFSYRGHPIDSARSQSGVIGVARSAGVEITSEVGSAVRRVDPRSNLPDVFRGRPDSWMGFEFAEQPFALGLKVASIRPRFAVTARSTITAEADRAGIVTTLLGRVWQGTLFEIRVDVPSGLTYHPAEPTVDGPSVQANRGLEPLVITFPRSLRPGDTFAVQLRGFSRLPDNHAGSVPLFQPLDSTVTATEVVLVSKPNLRLDPANGGVTWPRFTQLDPAAIPSGWTWPDGFDPNLGASAVWLRAEHSEKSVGIAVALCPRSIRHRSSLILATDRQGADVVDEIAGDVANGLVSTLTVALPPEVPDRWVAEAGENLDREALDPDPATGWRRYRIKLGEPTDSFQVRVRYRLDFPLAPPGAPPPAAGYRLRVEPIRLLDGTSSGQSVRLLTETDIELTAVAPGWTERAVEVRVGTESIQQVRRLFEHLGSTAPAAIETTATLGKLADLPTLVASRVWLRTVEIPGGGLASMVQYRLEAHPRSVVVRLPTGSRWIRGGAGAVELNPSDVEQVNPDTYRITLPAAVGAGPVPLRIDSVLDAGPADDFWPAPELVGGVVQQSAWEISLLGTRAGVGVPVGWNDENLWLRSGLLWKRQPRRTEADLARWLTDGLGRLDGPLTSTSVSPAGPQAGTAAVGPGAAWSGDFALGRHSYLFSRSGPPNAFRFVTWARVTLVLVCSGPVLLVGFLILGRRTPPRWVVASGLVLALGLAAAVDVNTVLLVVESSAVGVVLAAIAALIRFLSERRGRGPDVAPLGALVLAASPSELSATPLTAAEANDPTVVRPPVDWIDGSTPEYSPPILSEPTVIYPPEMDT